jgi:acetyl coenzyme A synthetase (ADP forming)-like protein
METSPEPVTPVLMQETDAYQLLMEAGIQVPVHELVHTRADLARAAARVGFPLVMKIVSPDIIHKSDVGGVVLGIQSDAAVFEAYDHIIGSVRQSKPGADIHGVLLVGQAKPGLEVYIGGKTDPTFGKVLTFGLGGTLVEVMHDVTLRVLPITEDEIPCFIREISGFTLISGFRDHPPLDEAALCDVIAGLAALFRKREEIIEFDINPLLLYEQGLMVVDARIYTGQSLPPDPPPSLPVPGELTTPRSIAVVGASSDPAKVGYAVFRNLLSFPGDLYPVNSRGAVIMGRQSVTSLSEIPGPVDMVVIAVPARIVPAVVKEAGEKGAGVVVIVSSGFRETGSEGAAFEHQILEYAREYGVRVVGPNCLGVIFPHLGINTTFDPIAPLPGSIGFIAQSGAVITTFVDWATAEGIGFSSVISVGNQIDLGFVDYLAPVADNPATRALILYIEEIRDGATFMREVSTITSEKPVIAVKSGVSAKGQRAASSHTGSLAGSFTVYQAALRQCGVIPARSLHDAFETALLLSSEGYPGGRRAVVISSAGGFGVLASDYADLYGIDLIDLEGDLFNELDQFLPRGWSSSNPVDILGDGGTPRFARVFDILARHQDQWDIIFVLGAPTAMLDSSSLAQEIIRFSRGMKKMVVGCLLGGDSMRGGVTLLRKSGIPNYADLDDAFRAVGSALAVRYPRGSCPLPEKRLYR